MLCCSLSSDMARHATWYRHLSLPLLSLLLQVGSILWPSNEPQKRVKYWGPAQPVNRLSPRWSVLAAACRPSQTQQGLLSQILANINGLLLKRCTSQQNSCSEIKIEYLEELCWRWILLDQWNPLLQPMTLPGPNGRRITSIWCHKLTIHMRIRWVCERWNLAWDD